MSLTKVRFNRRKVMTRLDFKELGPIQKKKYDALHTRIKLDPSIPFEQEFRANIQDYKDYAKFVEQVANYGVDIWGKLDSSEIITLVNGKEKTKKPSVKELVDSLSDTNFQNLLQQAGLSALTNRSREELKADKAVYESIISKAQEVNAGHFISKSVGGIIATILSGTTGQATAKILISSIIRSKQVLRLNWQAKLTNIAKSADEKKIKSVVLYLLMTGSYPVSDEVSKYKNKVENIVRLTTISFLSETVLGERALSKYGRTVISLLKKYVRLGDTGQLSKNINLVRSTNWDTVKVTASDKEFSESWDYAIPTIKFKVPYAAPYLAEQNEQGKSVTYGDSVSLSDILVEANNTFYSQQFEGKKTGGYSKISQGSLNYIKELLAFSVFAEGMETHRQMGFSGGNFEI